MGEKIFKRSKIFIPTLLRNWHNKEAAAKDIIATTGRILKENLSW